MTAERGHKNDGRLDVLDGLRGFMAYWVLLGHVFGHTGMRWVPILASPAYAVDGFMILSGFLMTWHYVRRAANEQWTSWRTWVAFYIRRFFRISPLYYVLLVPAYLLLKKCLEWQRADSAAHVAYTGLDVPLTWQNIVSHITFSFGLFPRFHASLPIPDWSISLEMQFYLLFPLLMLLVLRFGWTSLCIVAGATWYASNLHALGIAQTFTQPSPICLSLIWFAVGMVWAGRYAATGKPHVPSIFAGLLLALCSLDIHCILLVAGIGFVLFTSDVPVAGRVAALCRRTLSSRLAKFMAEASYAVYLVHLLILRPLAHALIADTRLGPNQRGIVALLVTTIGSYSLAMALHPIERWGISIGRMLAKRLAGQTGKPKVQVPVITPGPQQIVA